jgi:hypothetical protein
MEAIVLQTESRPREGTVLEAMTRRIGAPVLDQLIFTYSTSRWCFHLVQAWCNDYLATPRGLFCFFRCDPIHHLVVFLLLSDLFGDGRFIPSNCAYIISSPPKMPISKLEFQVGMSIKDHQRTLPIQVPHETRYAYLRRD